MTVVHAMLGSAALAAVLALIALAIGRASRSPAVRHAAWVVVLLKLVAPPLLVVPLFVLPASWAPEPRESPEDWLADRLVVLSAPPAPDAVARSGEALVPAAWERRRSLSLGWWACAAWAVGSVGWLAWQGRRIIRFRRWVAGAEEAPPEVAEAAERLAAELGIARPPEVRIATGIGSPMLWGWGAGAVVLFPQGLLARLTPEARDTLLAHELAHFLRRDHWVRFLEFIATGLYWWHPAVWLARRGIEAAEEECCDAWVVAGLAASPRVYAEALLATVDYEAELRRPCLPPGACAASRSARLLHRRLLGLIRAKAPGRLRGRAWLRALVVAALLVHPVLRAAPPEPAPPPKDPAPAPPAPRHAVSTAPAPRKVIEPRAWATATTPDGGLTVLARDHELVLRRADGTSRVLGPGRPIALAFAPGGGRVATAGPGPLVRTWHPEGAPAASARLPAAVRAIAYTPDGTRLLVLDASGRISVLDPQTLAVLADWSVEGPANSITCSPDSRTVAVSCGSWLSDSGWVDLWSLSERRRVARIPAPAPVGASRFTPDGRTLVVGCWNGLTSWRPLSGDGPVVERQLSKGAVAATAFCPDAATLPVEPPPEPAPPVVPEWPDRSELFPSLVPVRPAGGAPGGPPGRPR